MPSRNILCSDISESLCYISSMNRFLLLIIPCFLLFSCNAEKGSGNKVKEERKLDPFTVIENNSSLNVNITIGSPQSVIVHTDDNLTSMVKTDSSGGKLVIGIEGNYITSGALEVNIVTPDLKMVKLGGSGDITVTGLSNETFTAGVEGSGDLVADGRTNDLYLTVDGSGDIDTHRLRSMTARAEVKGSGSIKVNAEKSITARIDGSGDITTYGGAKVDEKVKGSGKVKKD